MTVEKTEAQAVAAAQGFGDQTQSDARHSARPDADRKAISTIQAQLALKGYELVPRANGTFIVRRWGLFRDLMSLGEAETFLAQIGGAQ